MRLWFTYLKATLAMLFWSLTFVWFKIAFRSYRPYEITFLRLALAAGLLFAVMWLEKSGKLLREGLSASDACGFLRAFYVLHRRSQWHAICFLNPGQPDYLYDTHFSALGAWLILKEKISLSLILGLLISTGGVAVMSLAAMTFRLP
jgi:drug/metabolite transporter (DMT)-like permease